MTTAALLVQFPVSLYADASLFYPKISYTFKVEAVRKSITIAFSTIQININFPPYGGVLTVTPQRGSYFFSISNIVSYHNLNRFQVLH